MTDNKTNEEEAKLENNGAEPQKDEAEATPTLEEVNEKLAKVQGEFKELRDSDAAAAEIANKQRAIEKYEAKIAKINNGDNSVPEDKNGYSFSQDDVHDMRAGTDGVKGFRTDSEEAKVVKQFIDAGMVGNVTEALSDPAVLVKLKAITAERNAKDVVDENDNDEYVVNAEKDIDNKYSAGEVPADETDRKNLAKRNLAKMNL